VDENDIDVRLLAVQFGAVIGSSSALL
jgi:hypothetical protein